MADAVQPQPAFAKVEVQNVDFPALERAILKFWDEHGTFEKRKQLNAGKPRWSFLDGPITANNPMGVHHAWGRTYKDAYNRYFAMTGHELRYQNGFDCQGLWVEVEVEKELKLASKRDIENLVPGDTEASIDRFVQACKDRVNKYARIQTEQSIRLGYWMNWDRTDADWAKSPDERKSYFTMAEVNNYTIWNFLKKCHTKGLIYRGYDSMPWCGRCGVGISEQEMKEGYKLTEHRSVFVRFALKDRPANGHASAGREYLLVWTTTPWTLPANVGAAVNPELTYLKVKLKGDVYYVAKGAYKLNRMEASGGSDDGDVDDSPRTSTSSSRSGPKTASTMSSASGPKHSSTMGSASGPKTGSTMGSASSKSRRDWLDGVPHLSSIEQHFKSKAGKEGFTVVGEVKGADMIGWEYAGPFDDLPAQQHEYGFPEEVAKVTKQSGQWPAKSAAQSHRIISGGDDVTETEGTGIVHTAPGCGAIDFVWGKDNGLPPIAPIDDSGTFVDGFGPLTGKNAADPTTADAVFEELKKKDALFVTERYVHRYPHCWRCKTELLYRLVDEWFISMGAKSEPNPPAPFPLREGGESPLSASGRGLGEGYSFRHEIMKVVKNPEVKFLPESINGTARELDWLRNMGDWMISKKRYWGLALPIWVNDADPTDFEVIGSKEELKARAVAGWQEFDGHTPHRPWVDRVKIESKRHPGQFMSRIPDVGNPWLDAGIVAFSTMPPDWYPADFITESFPGQFRNWFYALLAMSTMMSDGQPPFKTLLGFATMVDQFGKPMHKSDGNAIEFNAAAGDETNEGYWLFHDIDPKQDAKVALADLPKGHLAVREELVAVGGQQKKRVYARYKPIGADVMRWMYCRVNPAANLWFGPEPADEVRAKFVIKLWNCYGFFANYARLDGFDPTAPQVPVKDRPDIDRWILSDLQLLIRQAREAFEGYNVMAFCLAAEEFVDAKLSNWYIRRNRDRFWSKNADLDDAGQRDKLAAYQTLHTVLLDLCRLCAPVVPFLTEVMWQNLASRASHGTGSGANPPVHTGGSPASVHLADFPVPDESLIDTALSEEMDAVLDIVSLGGAARNAAKHKVRQPLAELRVSPGSDAGRRAVARFPSLITDELNVKGVSIHAGPDGMLRRAATLNPKTAKAKFRGKPEPAAAALASMDVAAVDAALKAGTFTLLDVPLGPEDVLIQEAAPEGWVGVVDKGTQVMIDTRLTPELKAEGMARDVVRLVQDARKDAGLDVADKIELHLGTDSEPLRAAIAAHRDTIAAETQAVRWADAPLTGEGVHVAEKKIDGQPLTITLRKV